MNVRRFLCFAGTFVCLTLLSTAAWAIDVGEWTHAAIAYAPSTGKFRYSYNYFSFDDAEQAALQGMTEKDAKIVASVNRGFCALAIGDDWGAYGSGYQNGDGATAAGAMDRALRNCRDVTKGARIAICLVSDGQFIHQPKDFLIPGTEDQRLKRYPNVDPFKTVTPLNKWFESNSHVPVAPQTNPLLPRNRLAPQLIPANPQLVPQNTVNPFETRFPHLYPHLGPLDHLNPEPPAEPGCKSVIAGVKRRFRGGMFG